MDEKTEHILTLSLPNSTQHLHLLNAIAAEILKETDFPEEVQEQINLAVIEAGANATEHSKENPGKQTTFQLVFADNELNITTLDSSDAPTDPNKQVTLLSLPSSMEYVYLMDVTIGEILKETDFPEEVREQINLAVIEAGTNAIKHGNKENPAKKATLEFALTAEELLITITDEGEGFARQEVDDPLDPENLLKSSGRGLFLMEACMDFVTYEANGTIIKMSKKLGTSETQ